MVLKLRLYVLMQGLEFLDQIVCPYVPGLSTQLGEGLLLSKTQSILKCNFFSL